MKFSCSLISTGTGEQSGGEERKIGIRLEPEAAFGLDADMQSRGGSASTTDAYVSIIVADGVRHQRDGLKEQVKIIRKNHEVQCAHGLFDAYQDDGKPGCTPGSPM